MKKEDEIILSTFVEVFKSFQISPFTQPQLKYDPCAKVSISGLDEIFFNGIYIKSPGDQKKLVEELVALQQAIAKPLTVWITPETETPEFEAKLKAHFESPGCFYGMLVDLKQAKLSQSSDRIRIEPVTTQKQAKEFAKIYCALFQLPSLLESITTWLIRQYEMDNPVCLNYLSRIDGVLAGTSSLAIDREFSDYKVGGFYNACVLPKLRNSGVATAMACHRVKVAKELGLDFLSIVLMSDGMARSYCEKLGFISHNTMTPYFIR
ncbi:MAG: GNAT family N-acetyltransferase [Tatlockia sp.]|nr:GNAT family N-acetyltransferase [Tatlockia sp.]